MSCGPTQVDQLARHFRFPKNKSLSSSPSTATATSPIAGEMRTRFLALDFFSVQTLASPSDASSLFLPFPVPAVPEPPPPEAAFCGFDHLELSLSYEFDGVSLGSEEALAFFLDEVLPWSYGYDGCGRFPAPWLSTPKCGPAEVRYKLIFCSDSSIFSVILSN